MDRLAGPALVVYPGTDSLKSERLRDNWAFCYSSDFGNFATSLLTTHPNTKMADAKAKEKPIASLIAGASAGGVEAFITYPLENLKTQLQFGGHNGQVSAGVV